VDERPAGKQWLRPVCNLGVACAATGYATVVRSDGNELSPLGKVVYKPFGLAAGLLGGLLAGKIFGVLWKRVAGEDEAPQSLSDDYRTREVLLAAAVQGALFGLIKTAIDRYGMKGVRRFLDAPLPPARRRVEQVRRSVQARAS